MKHHDLFRLGIHRAIHVFGIFAALSLVHVQVNAQVGPIPMPKRLDRFHVVVDGNIVKANYLDGYEGYGTHPYTKAQMNGASVPGGVSLSKQLAINTKNGLVVADATQKIGARQIAKGIGAVAGGPLGLTLLALPLILDLIDDSGLQVDGGEIKKLEQQHPTYTDAYEYQYGDSAWSLSIIPACNAWIAAFPGFQWSAPTYSPPSSCQSYRTTQFGSTLQTQVVSRRARTSEPLPPALIPASPQEVEDAITAQNPGPSILSELDKVGHSPMPDPADHPEVKNPVSSQEKTTTKTAQDGSTETEVCKTNATPIGNTLKLTETCTLTKRDPSGNVTDTSTKTSEDGSGTADTEPSMLCTLFPKIVACAELDTPTEEIPKKTETVDFDAENIGFGPGQCPPPFAWNDSLGTHELDLSAYCDALENYIQPIVVLMAAFAAFMIVAGGINRD